MCWACPQGPDQQQSAAAPRRSAGDRSQVLSQALADFHDVHRVMFVKYTRSRGVAHEEAEDVVNQAFLRLHRSQQSFLTAKNRSAFAFKVLRDSIADHFRTLDRRPRTAANADPVQNAQTTDGDIDALICRLDVDAALNLLPPRQADCLRLQLFLDLSRTQIAYYLDISASAVSSHLSVGRQHLSSHLQDYQPQARLGEERHG